MKAENRDGAGGEDGNASENEKAYEVEAAVAGRAVGWFAVLARTRGYASAKNVMREVALY